MASEVAVRVQKALIYSGLVLAAALPPAAADAANAPNYRDCSLIGGIDPDFVQLTGATISGGQLTVPQSATSVTLLASESSDPGDNSGHDTFSVTVSAPGIPSQTLSGMGTGSVTLKVPLSGVAVGSSYTIAWNATFDNGLHACPGGGTPQNSTEMPFVLTVVGGSAVAPPPTAPTITRPRQANSVWRLPGKGEKGTNLPVGTAFSFILDERARITLAFTQITRHALLRRGTVSSAGIPGDNSIAFKGRTSTGTLKPGKYKVRLTARDAAGLTSRAQTLSFTIK
jgi:hypothetical protein